MTVPVPAVFGVFQSTVDAVYRLIPEAERVTDPNNSQLSTPITEDTVAAWIVELSDLLAASIGDWADLPAPVGVKVNAAARAAVANGVASYVEAARYPTLAGLNDSSYGGVLWQRYLSMTAAIAAFIHEETLEGDTTPVDTGSDGTTGLNGPFAVFPPTYFTDGDPLSPWVEPLDPTAAW